MTLRLSTGLRNAVLDTKSQASNLATVSDAIFVDGGAGEEDSLTSSLTDLSVYFKGGNITVASANTSANDGTYEITASTAAAITVATASFTADTSNSCLIADASGGSYADLFKNCVIDIYSGSQPATADAAETGTKLVSITLDSGAFVAGAAANGLNFGAVASGVLAKETGQTWSGVGLATGTAGWFRIYDNTYQDGASTSEIRIDGAVATSGSQFNMSSTAVVTGATTTVDSVALTQPAA